jgi:DNA polymerase-1
MKKLLLIDGSNLFFRAYYATAAMGNLMQNSSGVYTNAIYGLASSMQSILKMDFTHILVALDPKGKTLRHELFEEYKGTRKDAPSELISQFQYIEEYLDSAGIPHYVLDKYEADDIIGYCATQYQKDFDQITIISNDHDLLQLLDTNVSQIISKKGFSDYEIYTPDYMFSKLGFHPSQMTDYKGLVGDASDNIPGIKGVGDKTAVKLLSEYQTLENIYEHTDELSGKLKERIVESKDIAFFSKKLATIHRDFFNPLEVEKLIYNGPNYKELVAFYQKMEFHNFLRKLEIPKESQVPDVKILYTVISTDEELRKILLSPMSVHLELFGSNYHNAQKIGFGLVSTKGMYFVPYDVLKTSLYFQNWLKDETKEKFVFDLKQTKVALLWDGYDLEGVKFDLLLAAYLTNPNITKDDFKVVVSAFNYQDVDYDDDIYQKGVKYSLPDDPLVYQTHIIKKAKAIFELREPILNLNLEYNQMELLDKIEMPLASTLSVMEFDGIKIDSQKLDEIGIDLKTRCVELEHLIYDLAGETFNINSPKQLGVILFEKLELPYSKKNKTGYSTDVSVLKQLEKFHPIISSIMEYRTLTKLFTTYVEGLKNSLELKNDSRIHTIYKQALTQTGRISSIEPNLQNIPIKTEEGKELRKVFIADTDEELYSCDYSQIELRVLAQMAGVEKLKTAFINGEDIHNATARLIFKTDQVDTGQRRLAKAINFGLIYGKTAWGLSEDLHISPKQAERFIANYFENYPEIKVFMDKQIDDAQKLGYVLTMFNRRRYIPEATSSNYQTREFGKRMAMNAPIQGSAADILKIAMVDISSEMKRLKLKSKLLLQIHDELVFSVTTSEKEIIEKIVKSKMETAANFSIPLTIEASFGQNLFEVK